MYIIYITRIEKSSTMSFIIPYYEFYNTFINAYYEFYNTFYELCLCNS